MTLTEYKKKRNFGKTPEPAGKSARRRTEEPVFVVQKHAASRLHYDFRLELDGVLKSWAVPKGPSLDPHRKSLAVQVEDHPVDYGDFEGIIPQGEYGGGTVMVWDKGTWIPEGDARRSYRQGKLKFELQGDKLQGRWTLVRMGGEAGEDGKNWLLIKEKDEFARPEKDFDVTEKRPRSVLSDRNMAEIAKAKDRIWSSSAPKKKSAGRSTSGSHPAVTKNSRHRSTRGKSTLDPGSLPGARRTKQPDSLQPELAVLVPHPPPGDDWLHEMKFDGYRILAHLQGERVKLMTRRGQDWTKRFPDVASAVQSLPLRSGILDGEVVVLRENGIPDFQRLQNAMKQGGEQFVYYVFDLPWCDGFDLTEVPLVERKNLLSKLVEGETARKQPTLAFSEHIEGRGEDVLREACRLGMEGIVSKDARSHYESRRSRRWVKSKCQQRQEFVIGGETAPRASRKGFGSLLLGYYDDDQLIYCGKVGTGFTSDSLRDISRKLKGLRRETSPFASVPRSVERGVRHWVRPQLVAEVEFTEWTSDGLLRHPSFKGLREDKEAKSIVRERAREIPATRAKSRRRKSTRRNRVKNQSSGDLEKETGVEGIELSHPDRVLYPSVGITKQQLAQFYVEIADWILPHVIERPLTLVRCPRGAEAPCFYQKHFAESIPPGVTTVSIQEKNKTDDYPVIQDISGLVSLVQLGVLEVHPWGARADDVEHPDRLIFDLDPGPDVDYSQVVEGAREVRQRLKDMSLESFVRTSGGKGLHVVVPLVRRRSWDKVKEWTHQIASAMTRDAPDRYIDNMSKKKRRGRIFVDYLRNGRGATAVASYSTRARPGAPVACPLRWDELSTEVLPDHYHVKNLKARLSALKGDPWEGFFELRQSITTKMLRKAGVKES